jgi:hypothetical protein
VTIRSLVFAGPWAEARADWCPLPLDGVDGNGLTFMDYLRTSLRVNANDLRQYVPHRDLPGELFCADMFGEQAPAIPLARDQSWYAELETYWPTIRSVAGMLMSGVEVTPDMVGRKLRLPTDVQVWH